MKTIKESMMLGKLLEKLAPSMGAMVEIEPEWGMVGKITFRNGKRSYFRYNTLDLNPMGSAEIAKDKGFANYFMAKSGYPIVPQSQTFFSDTWAHTIGSVRTLENAVEHGKNIGYPCIVKPNSGSQGVGVFLVHSEAELRRALENIFTFDRVALVQKYVSGRDYRIVVLDDTIISVYERIPLNIIGDGVSTIEELLFAKQSAFASAGRDTQINHFDERMHRKLERSGFSFNSIVNNGQKIFLLDNANLSSGGDSEDMTETAHDSFKHIAIQLTKDMGLRLCGVDIIISHDITQPHTDHNSYCVLEINAAPGLDHYSKLGIAQEERVEKMYTYVLEHLERDK
jgi:D-alanine-D-alanine ligase-like ATP-grasp enzyme